nr:unnamed protein product [Naegleria fowleri]
MLARQSLKQNIHQTFENHHQMISNLKDPSSILFTDPMSGIPLVFNPCSNKESTNDIIKHNLKFFSDMQVDGLFQELCQEWLDENMNTSTTTTATNQDTIPSYEILRNFLAGIGIEQEVIEKNISALQKRELSFTEGKKSDNSTHNNHSLNDLFTQYKAFPYIQIEWNE